MLCLQKNRRNQRRFYKEKNNNLGEIFPQPLLLGVFKYFLLKHFILYVFVIFHKKNNFLLFTLLIGVAESHGKLEVLIQSSAIKS